MDLKALIAPIIVFTGIILFVSQTQSARYVDALQQVAGSITIKIKSGETKTFNWGLRTDKNESNTVTLSADGSGANFLSFPKTVDLNNDNITNVLVKVGIPSDYVGNKTLSPKIRATEAGEKDSPTILNIQMAKTISVIIDSNGTNSTSKNATGGL
jgi:hypothetical protein